MNVHLKKKRKLSDGVNSTNVERKKWMGDMDNLEIDDIDFYDDDFNNINNENLNTFQEPEKKYLDLSIWQRCRVLSVTKSINHDVILELEEETNKLQAICHLQGPWIYSLIDTNDVVSVIAIFNKQLNYYIINLENGFLVTTPDNLISGTSVVGSLFCQRRGILAERFRGVDSNNKIMAIGSIIHQLFQSALNKNLHTINDIKHESKNLTESRSIINLLYTTKMTLNELKHEINIFVPKIYDFMKKYVLNINDTKTLNSDIFNQQIDEIQDIEENVWLPRLGLKGKVDVTVKLKNNKVLPLELKTGRSSFSYEHRGQIILYKMMLNELNNNINSGLLLYIRDGLMKEILSTRNDERDLIILRNNLSYYIKNNLKNLLPEPINHRNACSKCPYNIICCTYLNHNKDTLQSDHPLNELKNNLLKHLTDEHVNYFIKWTSILLLEDHNNKNNSIKSLWLSTSEKRLKNGFTFINLIIHGKIVEDIINNRFIHVFTTKDNDYDFTLSKLNENDYIIISIKDRIAISSGFIRAISKNNITVDIDRDLTKNYKNEIFLLDKCESQSFITFNMTNLGLLLNDNEITNQLRSIIIDKIKPSFINRLPKIIKTEGSKILLKLNEIQRNAVIKSLTTNNYLLIKGLPGTGKTHTLVALIRLFYLLNQKVLITSHTHSAVDNLLKRLKDYDIKFLRIGSIARIDSTLIDYSDEKLIEKCKTPEELEASYKEFKIVGVTCLGASHSMLQNHLFDVCLVDESTQVLQPSVIRPLLYAKKFILVGDPDQLPPIVQSAGAKNLGGDESLFACLDNNDTTAVLTIQYRMNKNITNLANKLTYNNKLLCGNDDISKNCIKIPNYERFLSNYGTEKWLLKVLTKNLDHSCILLDTNNTYNLNISYINLQKTNDTFQNKNYINYYEASVILYIIHVLIDCGVSATTIGIIAPYREQVNLLRKVFKNYYKMNEKLLNGQEFIEINTVDQYQGRDKNIIIYCCTRTHNFETNNGDELKSTNDILNDKRRLTVAVTRAKNKLIIIGDLLTLNAYKPFNSLLECINNLCKIKLNNGMYGFSWDNVINNFDTIMYNDFNDSLLDLSVI